MEKIEPTYVSFEQAKIISKYFDEIRSDVSALSNKRVYAYHHSTDEYRKVSIRTLSTSHNSQQYNYVSKTTYHAPEQWEVVEWLRVNRGIWISVDMVYETAQTGFWYSIRQSKEDDKAIFSNEYTTPQEAYSAAFDYVLNNLI